MAVAAAAASLITRWAPQRPSWLHLIWQAPEAREPQCLAARALTQHNAPLSQQLGLGGNQLAIRRPLPSPWRRCPLWLEQPQALMSVGFCPVQAQARGGENTLRQQRTQASDGQPENSVSLPASPRGSWGVRAGVSGQSRASV